ncbi:ester cyclase [Roseibium porphyridii]|uniref:Ester cyclase n=1 Tax=Roseibium porphyridii TaxID=2866279 RepID=A0ABY8FFG2_9HYPH|nr:ester cyclase [Roseibium sp. KMA01]WFE91985.1 ester cyclase [Roseibium sp. KMA01]
MSEKLEVVKSWFERVWAQEDEGAIEELFVSDGPARGLGTYVRDDDARFADHARIGPEGFKEFHRSLLKLVGNVDISVTMDMEQGDWLALLCVLKATKRGTDMKVQTTGTIFIKVANGQIIEAYNHFDFMSLFGQLGLLPENTFGECLCGERIGV